METSFSTVEKEFESCHIIFVTLKYFNIYMADIALTPIYLPVHVLWFESQKEKKLVITWNLGCKYIKLFAFYQYLQQTIWKINLIIHGITVVKNHNFWLLMSHNLGILLIYTLLNVEGKTKFSSPEPRIYRVCKIRLWNHIPLLQIKQFQTAILGPKGGPMVWCKVQ